MCDCMNGDPVPGDPRFEYHNQWQTGMMNAPCADPVCFCAGLLFPCGSACYIRRKSLDGNMQHYKCCQGYYDCMCWKAGILKSFLSTAFTWEMYWALTFENVLEGRESDGRLVS